MVSNKKIFYFAGIVVLAIGLAVYLSLSEETETKKESISTEENDIAKTDEKKPEKIIPEHHKQVKERAMRRAAEYQRNHPTKPTIPKPTGKDEAIQRIKNKAVRAIDRVEAFKWLKENDRAEALQIAKPIAEDYSNRAQELYEAGDDDTGPMGDWSVGVLSAELVMENHLEQMKDADPVDKMRYLATTAWEKTWVQASGSLTRSLCDDIDGRIPEATKGLHPYAAYSIILDCNNIEGEEDYCRKDCAEEVWNNFSSDWSSWGFYLKMSLFSDLCKDNRPCRYLNEFLKYFRMTADEPLESDLRKYHFYFIQKSSVHCLPYDEFVKKIERTGNTVFLEMLKRERPMYERFLRRCQN